MFILHQVRACYIINGRASVGCGRSSSCLVTFCPTGLARSWSDSNGSEDFKKTSRTALKIEKASFSEMLLSTYSNIHGVMCQKAGMIAAT